MPRFLLALDYGGTKLSAALTTAHAREWLALERIISPPEHNAQYEQRAMLKLARKILNGKIPAAIGISFGGPVDFARGLVLLSHHVAGWENIFLRDQWRAEFGAPVEIDNDANVAALGEFKFGAGRACASLLYVTVSTGVGGGWIVDGKILRGADGVAGEIGHTIFDPNGPLCICGRRGCVEVFASGRAIARIARERLIAHPRAESRVRELIAAEITAQAVARAAQDGDEFAQSILDDAARALGFGIGTAITLLNPERVVIGGGVSKAGEKYFAAVRVAARANCLPQMRVEIVPAALGDDAPLWGAVALAQEIAQK
ncbi:MAG: ROK family protein [Chloroflexi bacterium]|nr:ROK family protein [Chloroflexota bacterium]